MKFKQLFRACALLAVTLVFSSCDKEKGEAQDATVPATNIGSLNLTVNNTVGNVPLTLATDFQNANQDTFSILKLQYFLSNVVLVREDGELVKIPSSYHLFTQSSTVEVKQKTIDEIPGGTYTGMRLAIGIDSVSNGFNDGEGDLSAANSPLWDWNTGYKFLVVEGNYKSMGLQEGIILHIGTDFNYRILQFDFAAAGAQNLVITNGQTSEVVYDFDLYQLFNSVHKLNLQIDSHATGGPAASKLADNYGSNTLKLKQVIN